jgi:hypothetical protein
VLVGSNPAVATRQGRDAAAAAAWSGREAAALRRAWQGQ